jgi:rubrerythrin
MRKAIEHQEDNIMTTTGFSAGDALRYLAEREEEGVSFYEGLMEGTKSEFVRDLAEKLGRAEKRHKQRFLEYAARADAGEEEGGDRPVPLELQRLLKSRLFVEKERIRQSAQYASDVEMIKVAIGAEEKAALVVAELAQYVPRNQRPYLARVLKEEKGHQERLQKVLQRLLEKT